MLEVKEQNITILLLMVLVKAVWRLYLWITKHKKWLLAYYLWKTKIIMEMLKHVDKFSDDYPNEVTNKLCSLYLNIASKKFAKIKAKTSKIMGSLI